MLALANTTVVPVVIMAVKAVMAPFSKLFRVPSFAQQNDLAIYDKRERTTPKSLSRMSNKLVVILTLVIVVVAMLYSCHYGLVVKVMVKEHKHYLAMVMLSSMLGLYCSKVTMLSKMIGTMRYIAVITPVAKYWKGRRCMVSSSVSGLSSGDD